MKKYYSLWTLVLLLLIPNCRSVGSEPPTTGECWTLVTSFFELPRKEQLKTFSALSLERQYVTYICGMKSTHPPPFHLTTEFAKEGKVVFPFLAKKLRETQEDSYFRYLVWVLSDMQQEQTYDVVADKDLMLYMRKRASEIRDEFWRNHVREILDRMVKPR
mgnify:CR=1 FL=1